MQVRNRRSDTILIERATDFITQLVADTLNIPVNRINSAVSLETYGIDSIMVVQLVNALSQELDDINSTLFFEFQTIDALVAHLVATQKDRLMQLLDLKTTVDSARSQSVERAGADGGKAADTGGQIEVAAKASASRPAKTASRRFRLPEPMVQPAAGPERLPQGQDEAITVAARRPDAERSAADLSANKKELNTGPLEILPQGQSLAQSLDVAIIGLSGRFPEAANIAEFWQNLIEGKNCIRQIPDNRWSLLGFYESDRKTAAQTGKSYSKWGGFLEAVDQFDPLFFNISPRDAERMDPQERLFLEEAYHCLEDAGYTARRLIETASADRINRVGLFVGVMNSAYATGAHYWSIANRISYLFDFQGPSLAIDTACSSSLSAIHFACRSLACGDSDVALAGGVNLLLSADQYVQLSAMTMLSSGDKNKSFAADADGFVDGEAVAVALLKPLPRAQRDGDAIYGVIKGSAVNSGGKTNGYTVPNPVAQAELIRQALTEAKVDARAVTYIEAHGTGTSLGDPIEIAGLSQSFRQDTEERQFCAIGSVKSNIGHCESAAGIAGMIKVLMQFKHQMLVPSIHSAVLNPGISFADTPFWVQQTPAQWARPELTVDGEQQVLPLTAGVSSFGAGGANAHIILQEHRQPQVAAPARPIDVENPVLIVLSAKSALQLQQQVQQLLAVLPNHVDEDLLALAYTLQVGREAMAYRLALVVVSIDQLQAKLKSVAAGDDRVAGAFIGNNDSADGESSATVGEYFSADDVAGIISQWLLQGNFNKLLKFWAQGGQIDWLQLYENGTPTPLRLPTYPFIRERFWLETLHEGAMTAPTEVSVNYIHPLLQQNTSDFSVQRYSSYFTGEEFFLADHVVDQQPMLPAVAYLEMARSGMHQASAEPEQSDRVLQLSEVFWLRPLMVANAVPVDLLLLPTASDDIEFEIVSRSTAEQNTTEKTQLHCRGRGRFVPTVEVSVQTSLDVAHNIASMQSDERAISDYYRQFADLGIHYGQAHRALAEVWFSRKMEPGSAQLLAKLRLPDSLSNTLTSTFELHPSMMDGALQAGAVLLARVFQGPSAQLPLMLPYSLQEMQVLRPCASELWAQVSLRSNAVSLLSEPQLDIFLYDEDGQLCVSLTGFSCRQLGATDSAQAASPLTATDSQDTLVAAGGNARQSQTAAGLDSIHHQLLKPHWQLQAPALLNQIPQYSGAQLVIGGCTEQHDQLRQHYPALQCIAQERCSEVEALVSSLQEVNGLAHIIWIGQSEPYATGEEIAALSLFRVIKALLALGYESQALQFTLITFNGQQVIANTAINASEASVQGLAGVLAKEYRRWTLQFVDLDSEQAYRHVLPQLLSLPADKDGSGWAYHNSCWHRQTLLALAEPSQPDHHVYRQYGIYLVIGGSGGIGVAWTENIVRSHQAQVVWVGRRSLDESIQNNIDRIAAYGPAPVYIQADASDLSALQGVRQSLLQRFGDLHGVIHSAVDLHDQSLSKANEASFVAGMRSKVDLSIHLAQVFAAEKLDFVLFFSSLGSFSRNPGQSSYASGSTFNDAFALALNERFDCPVKVLNWGFWASGGAASDAQTMQLMARFGLAPIEPSRGMLAVQQLLSSPMQQLALLATYQPLDLVPLEELPTPHLPALVQHLEPQFESIRQPDISLPDGDDFDALVLELVWHQLRSIGLFQHGDMDWQAIASIVIAEHHRWLRETLRLLCEQGYLLRQEDLYCIQSRSSSRSAQPAWKEWQLKSPHFIERLDIEPHIKLLSVMVPELPAVLTGEKTAVSVMFPRSSMELVEGLYKRNRLSDHFNTVLADALIAYLEKRRAEEPNLRLRVLEVGAGTGGTTTTLLERLKPYQDCIEEYCYTDLSPVFLAHGKKAFGKGNPFMRYQVLNIESSLAEQAVDLAHYDVVIAANVLHATRDMRVTMANVRHLLQVRGILLLNEISNHSMFAHVTFGLLEGWWLYEDDELRLTGSPCLEPESWQYVLQQTGFEYVAYPAQHSHNYGQQIIMAQAGSWSFSSTPQAELSLLFKQLGTLNRDVATPSPGKLTPPPQSKPATAVAVDSTQEAMPAPLSAAAHHDASDRLRTKTVDFLKKMIAQQLKIEPSRIQTASQLDEYGFDSIMIQHLAGELSEHFDDVTSTLFFEYQTIDELAGYFLQNHKPTLVTLFDIESDSQHLSVPSVPSIPSVTTDITATDIEFSGDTVVGTANRFQERMSPQPQRLTQPINTREPVATSDVAIIGVSGRFPKAENIQQFWQSLKRGENCISTIPSQRWPLTDFFESDKTKAVEQGQSYSQWGGFLDGVDLFDPLFFNISPRDAKRIDPQERLFLEEAYRCIEDAGYTPENVVNRGLDEADKVARVGVFVGVMNSGYATGANYWSVANRVSYSFDFQGPSMAIDSACSSSLTALNVALESIYVGTSDCALVGGVNLLLDPEHYIHRSAMTMLSSDDKNKTFSADADGFVDGEAVCALLIKPLVAAEQDRDHIYGVIKGCSVNAGGRTNGFTVPNPKSQARLIRETLEKSGVNARHVSYLEAHGTGTALGDPIEIAGLSKAFRNDTADRQFCAIGSVKSNIGHCESAAGITGVVKVLLQLQHQQLVPTLHAKTINPEINFANSPFVVQQHLAQWPRPTSFEQGVSKELPRIAGVSSFGAGGANAHVVIQEYSTAIDAPVVDTSYGDTPLIVLLSAKNKEALQHKVAALIPVLEVIKEAELLDMAYTLQVGREAMSTRMALQVTSKAQLVDTLKTFANTTTWTDIDGLYFGELREQEDAIQRVFTDQEVDGLAETWLSQGNYSRLMSLWVEGFAFDWSRLYIGRLPKRLSLPTYPFARERYWLDKTATTHIPSEIASGVVTTMPTETAVDSAEMLHTTSFASSAAGREQVFSQNSKSQAVINIVAETLELEVRQLSMDTELNEYGMDSISFISILQKLQTLDPEIDIDKVGEAKTLNEILALLPLEDEVLVEEPEAAEPSKKVAPESATVAPSEPNIVVASSKQQVKPTSIVQRAQPNFIAHAWPQFPELIRLNRAKNMRPVFWIHDERGGLDGYDAVASQSSRPFYGIQPRGWLNSDTPLKSIQEMAVYYCHIIKTVQPEGPYDLGGMSLGGTIAYEIARQLQELEDDVNSLLMVNSICTSTGQDDVLSMKHALLQSANYCLMKNYPAEMIDDTLVSSQLIRAEQLDFNVDVDQFQVTLMGLAQQNNDVISDAQFQNEFQQMGDLVRLAQGANYTVLPLSRPEQVTLYYFRNKARLLSRVFDNGTGAEEILDDSLKIWQENVTNCQVAELKADQLLLMLSSTAVQQQILPVCEGLYG